MHTVFSIDKIAEELGIHFNKFDLDTYKAQCPICWASVAQDVDACPNCGTPVVWEKSKVWKRKFGDPKARIAQLEMVDPVTQSGIFLCEACRTRGFSNVSEQAAWAKAERWFGESRMRDIAGYVTRDKRGRGAMAHALAIARKKLREERPKKKPQDTEAASSTSMI